MKLKINPGVWASKTVLELQKGIGGKGNCRQRHGKRVVGGGDGSRLYYLGTGSSVWMAEGKDCVGVVCFSLKDDGRNIILESQLIRGTFVAKLIR